MTGSEPTGLDGIRDAVGSWFDQHQRDLPWRRNRDPYWVWLSEIMLQQTRVDQALPYFERFINRFPTVRALADASQDEVLKAWEGLGYYSRARNLHRAAKVIVSDWGGEVPQRYEALITLPGIGDYTASAVASTVFGEVQAVLDGNVIRVLARLDALNEDVSRSPVRRKLRARAQELVDPKAPGRHNEAMMELGATICSPRAPNCASCPIAPWCASGPSGEAERYPVKKKKAPVPHYDIAVGVVSRPDGRLLIQKRPEDGLLGGLWEFPGGKCEDGEPPAVACARELQEELGIKVTVDAPVAVIPHAYSHFKITLHAFRCTADEHALPPEGATGREGQPIRWVVKESLSEYAFPRANQHLIEALGAHSTLFD